MPKSLAGSYDARVRQHLEDAHEGLSTDFARLTGLPSDVADRVIAYLLSLGCQCQNLSNITLGREFLLVVDRSWLVSRIDRIASTVLNLNDGWEYRRLLELYALLDDALVARLVTFGQMSMNSEVLEAAADFASLGANELHRIGSPVRGVNRTSANSDFSSAGSSLR